MPQHIGLLVEHAAVFQRDDLAGLYIEVGLPCERCAGGRIDASRALQRPEALAEGDLRGVVHRLVAEDQNAIGVEGVMDFAKCRGVQRLGNIDAGNLGGEDGRQGRHGERHG